ncbi:MAG TPA: NADH-quinone oxidoreductase subunit I [Dehalococcoidia bacterium]|nr:NADH-quinone oxidoreductase subunit I [Dehalococcoidia bacterium]
MKFERYGIGIAKGLRVTFKHLFRRPVTVQYPEQKLHMSRRIRGNELIWDKDKCTGCATCAKTCPQGVIQVITSVDAVENKYVVEKFEVDTGYCISCGLCIEACPYEALYMGYAYERAKYRREDVIQTNEQLLPSADRLRSGYMYPEIAAQLPRQTLLLERITEEEE